MKKFKNLLLLPSLLLAQTLSAQTTAHLKLSDEHPAAGEKVSFTYDPRGTVLEGKADIKAIAYFLDNKTYPASDLNLKSDGKSLSGEFVIPEATQAFLLKLSNENTVDDNAGKGYVYLVYKNGQPVPGAYAAEGYNILNGMANYLSGINSKSADGIELVKRDFSLHPQVEKEYQSAFYNLLARSPENAVLINDKIRALLKSADEKELMLASDLLASTKRQASADSLNSKILERFPNGQINRNQLWLAASVEKDLPKKDSLFADLLNKYPDLLKDQQTLDRINTSIAYSHLKAVDIAGFNKYADKVKNKISLEKYLNSVAWDLAESGKDLTTAEKLAKESVDIISSYQIDPPIEFYLPPSVVRQRLQNDWNASADTYAYILWKEGKSSEALPYMKKVYDLTSTEVNSIEHYSQILAGVGQYAEAISVIEKGFRDGQSSQVTKDELKKDYIKVKGSVAGFEQYLASLEAIAKAKALADLAKTMINQPAPAFTLKDLDGNTVSLSDLKGKVVIVDFWATWCGPCKASFPGMQLAVNKYKDDPNVKFLFIDTWENGKDYEAGVRKFITANNYTFHVLIDEKNDAGRQAKVVTAFDVSGIPTKFVIDKAGNIRFKYIGYSGSTDKVLDEVVNMIELTANPQLADAKAPAPEKGSK